METLNNQASDVIRETHHIDFMEVIEAIVEAIY
jgi:hypothetical protein